MKIYGSAKTNGLYFKADIKSNLKTLSTARVIPQPGQGILRKYLNTQGISKAFIIV